MIKLRSDTVSTDMVVGLLVYISVDVEVDVKVCAGFVRMVAGVFLVLGWVHASADTEDACVPVRFELAKEPFCLEVADTYASRETGLQNRNNLSKRGGMIFIFPENEPVLFWMKDTLIELDIIFLDSAGVIQSMVTRVPPSPIKIYGSARYVIELSGGEGEAMGIWPGDKVSLPERLTRPVFK